MYILFLGTVVVVVGGGLFAAFFTFTFTHTSLLLADARHITTFDEKINNYVLLLYSVYVFT